MKFRDYFVCLLLLATSISFACKCREMEREAKVELGLKNADIIFYGELIKSDSIKGIFSFKIIEIFKGNYSKTIINGQSEGSNCNLFPTGKGLWIVYGNFDTAKTVISMSACSPCQSLESGPGWPTPPIVFDKSGKVRETTAAEYRLFDLEDKTKSLNFWIFQMEKLRQYKLAQNTLTEASKSDFKDKLIIGSLIANALLLLTILGIIVSKKTANNRIAK